MKNNPNRPKPPECTWLGDTGLSALHGR
jgi:hypothetical protein